MYYSNSIWKALYANVILGSLFLWIMYHGIHLQNICSFTLICIVFRYNNFPLGIALTSPSSISFLSFFSLSLGHSNGTESRSFSLFCFVCDEKVESIWYTFFWMSAETNANGSNALGYIWHSPNILSNALFYPYMHCLSHRKEFNTHTQRGTKKKTQPFQCFFFKAYTKFPFTTVVQK